MRLIGIDCATQAKSVGVASARWGTKLVLETVELGRQDLVEQVAGLINQSDRCLIAIDAPLGWPDALRRSLGDHVAGQPISASPNALFRRATDRFIKAKLGKQPLDVGADRIARTAHAALTLLEGLRRRTGQSIPLAWTPKFSARVAVIEVYPAGTLRARRVRDGGYKRPAQEPERVKILDAMSREMTLCDDALMRSNADALDAAVCVLAARDFLAGVAMHPEDDEAAKREGWIWCSRPIP